MYYPFKKHAVKSHMHMASLKKAWFTKQKTTYNNHSINKIHGQVRVLNRVISYICKKEKSNGKVLRIQVYTFDQD